MIDLECTIVKYWQKNRSARQRLLKSRFFVTFSEHYHECEVIKYWQNTQSAWQRLIIPPKILIFVILSRVSIRITPWQPDRSLKAIQNWWNGLLNLVFIRYWITWRNHDKSWFFASFSKIRTKYYPLAELVNISNLFKYLAIVSILSSHGCWNHK